MARFFSLAVVFFAMVYSVLAFPHIRHGRDLQAPYFNGTQPYNTTLPPTPPYGSEPPQGPHGEKPPSPPYGERPPPPSNGTAPPSNGTYVSAYEQASKPVRRNIRNFPISLRVPGRA